MDNRVKVRYLGLVQNAIGVKEEDITVPNGASVGELLRALLVKHGDGFRYSVLRTDGALRPPARVLVDGLDIKDLDGLDTKVTEKGVAIVVIVDPLEGG